MDTLKLKSVRFPHGRKQVKHAYVLLGVGVMLFLYGCTERPKSQGPETARYVVETRDISSDVVVFAPVEAEVREDVRAPLPAKVIEVKAEKGKRVKKGDVLVELQQDALSERADDLVFEEQIAVLELEKAESLAKIPPRDNEGDNVRIDAEIARAKLAQVRSRLAHQRARAASLHVVSPVDGVVIELFAEPGRLVTGPTDMTLGTTLLQVANTEKYTLNFSLTEYEIARIKEGDPVVVTFESVPELRAVGVVKSLAYAGRSSFKATSFPTVVAFGSTSPEIRLGMYARATVAGQKKMSALCVPITAVYYQDAQAYVNVRENGASTRRAVRLGISDAYYAEVVEGLAAGTEIALDYLAARVSAHD